MEDLKIEELKILIAVIKWLAGIVSACVPFVIAAFIKINKNTSETRSEVTLLNLKHENLADNHNKLELSHKELSKFVYNKN